MLNNQGQSLIGIIIVLIVVGLITGGLYYYLSKQTPEVPEITEKPAEEVITPEGGAVTSSKEELPKEEVIPEKKPVAQKCTDGTPYGQCSTNKPKYCDNGNLVDNASLCGCPIGYKISDNHCAAITLSQKGMEYWAVIFGTVKEADVGLQGFNHLPLVLKDILIQHGWQESHIKYFVGENATFANVITALDWLANNTGSNDVVLFYSMTHGASAGISLSDKFLEFSELAERLDKIRYNGMVIVIDACYSGGAIPFLKKEGRVIMTSTRSTEMGVNDIFSKRLLAALQGFGDIEGNNNEWVSAEEAFNFAQTRHAGPQSRPWPQIQDDYPGELNILFLDGYWRYLDQLNMEKGKSSFTGSNCLGGDPLNDDVKIYAQSFKPNYPILTKAMLGVYFGSGNPGPLTVSVRKDLSGPDLTSATLNQTIIRPFSSELYEFDFPDIEVIPNKTYYLVMEFSYTIEKNDYYELWIDNSGSYPEGSYSRGTTFFKGIRPSIPWTDMSPTDLYFATFGKPK